MGLVFSAGSGASLCDVGHDGDSGTPNLTRKTILLYGWELLCNFVDAFSEVFCNMPCLQFFKWQGIFIDLFQLFNTSAFQHFNDFYHTFHGALPLLHNSSRCILSRRVSIGCQKPECLKATSSRSRARPSSGSFSKIVLSPAIRLTIPGSRTKKPPLIQEPSPTGFS